MKYKLITILFMAIFLIGIVSAKPSFVFTKDTQVDLRIPVFQENNNPVTSATKCNISIQYPNESILVDNGLMSFNAGGIYNYTILSEDLNANGEYSNTMYCNDGTDFGFSSFSFFVNTAGNYLETPESIIYLLFFIVLIFTFLISLYFSITIPFNNKWGDNGLLINVNDFRYLKVVAIVFSYLILMSLLGLSRQVIFNYLHLNGTYRIVEWMYWLMLSFVWPIIIFSIIMMIVMFITGKRLKKALDRGFNIHKNGDIR